MDNITVSYGPIKRKLRDYDSINPQPHKQTQIFFEKKLNHKIQHKTSNKEIYKQRDFLHPQVFEPTTLVRRYEAC